MFAVIYAVLISTLLRGVYGRSLPELQEIVTTIKTAVVRTKIDPYRKFLGAGGSPTIYNPYIGSSIEWSAARMKLQNGPESIEVGWMVNSGLFNNSETHLYVRYKIGQSTCLNTQCPGFVHVGEAVPLSVKVDHYSEYGARQQYFWRFFIDKHEDDGHWWVSMNDDKYGVGYWPKSLFNGLADAATQVEWGGEVGVDPQLEKQFRWPQMGNGRRAVYKPKYSAVFLNVTVIHTEDRQSTEPDNTEKFMDWKEQYTVLDAGHRSAYFGRLILYDGNQA